MTPDVTISELSGCTDGDFGALAVLMRELSPEIVLSRKALDAMLADSGSHLYVVRMGERIVGCASLCIFHQPFSTDATIEAVVVSSDMRGRGLGVKLMQHLISEASGLGVDCLHLTSNPKRVAANALYQRMGFSRKETNCYILNLEAQS